MGRVFFERRSNLDCKRNAVITKVVLVLESTTWYFSTFIEEKRENCMELSSKRMYFKTIIIKLVQSKAPNKDFFSKGWMQLQSALPLSHF